MADMAGFVLVLNAVVRAKEDEFAALRRRLPVEMLPTGPDIEVFDILIDEPVLDAGIAVTATARRSDGRLVQWLVEVWTYPDGRGGWSTTVKAEIDLDDSDGRDRCVLNEQESVADPTRVVHAIRSATDMVVNFPLGDLLTAGWEPQDWNDDEDEIDGHTSTGTSAEAATFTTTAVRSGPGWVKTTTNTDTQASG